MNGVSVSTSGGSKPTTLAHLQRASIEMFVRLRSHSDGVNSGNVAAPFVSVPLGGYGADKSASVLYVGQGTYCDWYRDQFLAKMKLSERRSQTILFLKEQVLTGEYSSGFWRFAVRLSDVLSNSSEQKET